MIYTVGHKESYDKGIEELGVDFKKLGFRKNYQGRSYSGGSVWVSYEEAKAYLDANSDRLATYEVYGVLATWETDTAQLQSEPFRRLMNDSVVVRMLSNVR